MFGQIGWQEILLILFVLLLLFGARRLPELGQSLGKGIREFKRGIHEIQDDIDQEDRKTSPSSREGSNREPSSSQKQGE